MSKRLTNKNNYFLDVAQIIATEPQKLFQSPVINPVVPQASLHLTPINYSLNMPLITQFQRYQPSPYLKQLINPRNYAEIQFLDFTLQGPTQQDIQFEKKYLHGQYNQYGGDLIQQDENEYQKSDLSHANYSNFDSLPFTINWIESSKLNIKAFKSKLKQFRNQFKIYGESSNKQNLDELQMRQFVQGYLTEQDFQKIKQKQQNQISLEDLIKLAQHNLRNVGPISWLQRKFKVQRYMQKKKKRIWNKKINYDCRKKVAENRLRIKGKFVTQQQARNLIGVQQDCSLHQLKQILTKKDKKID